VILVSLLTIPLAFAQDRKPNILIIYADDLGFGDVPFNGRKDWQTPNLDRLAKEGTVFKRWYTASPVCTPSRGALLTGKYTIHNACTHLGSVLPSSEVTIAEALKPAGYATALFGKWHLSVKPGETGDPIDQGFEEFFGFMTGRQAWQKFPKELCDQRKMVPVNGYSDEMFTDHALDYIQRKKDQPWFLYLAYNTPHGPVEATKEDTAPLLGKFEEKDPTKPYNAMYAAMIERQDKEIGRVLKELDDLKLADDTLIIYTSDNGATFEPIADGATIYFDSNHPLRGQKRNLWEGGIREPAVARWPGHIQAGAESHEVVHMTDVFPTVCAAADAKVDPAWKVDGQNVLDALEGKAKIAPRTLFWEWRYEGSIYYAAMRGDIKLVICDRNKPELFNVERDPAERINIMSEESALGRRLKKELDAWMSTETEATKKQLPSTEPVNIGD
jgi:arylsulfatase A-like enzyme